MVKKGNKEFYEDLVREVSDDFKRRQEERRALEVQWELNMNYIMGNQYCDVSPTGDLEEEEKYYSWQKRSVYNHIAPIIDTRTAKLARVRPKMCVRANSDEDKDLKTAEISTAVLRSCWERNEADSVIFRATQWSETCGTAFYKVLWNGEGGKCLGLDGSGNAKLYEGNAEVIALSPFEIYPDQLLADDIESCKSIIHARAVPVEDIERQYGVAVDGEDIDIFALSPVGGASTKHSAGVVKGVKRNCAIVIERYEKPSKTHVNGRIVTVAGNKLLYVGELPYENGEEGRRTFPFIRQCSLEQTGCFFGAGMAERLIPIQRAYNAVKNRKHEFINRLSMGVLTVEDGSIDSDELVEEGLCPGKILVYRQGSAPPAMMRANSVPTDFSYEEERLYNEFINISGISEISRNSLSPTNVTSGVALELLIEQDDTRLTVTAENIRRAVKQIGKNILRLYKQFAVQTRIAKIVGDGKTAELFYFNSSDISGDDIVFETENEMASTPAQQKSAVYDLLGTGLLQNERGAMDDRTKAKVLEILGFGGLDNAQDITALHISRAGRENLESKVAQPVVESYDDHATHITEHTRYLISGEYERQKEKTAIKARLSAHIEEHKLALARSGAAVQ